MRSRRSRSDTAPGPSAQQDAHRVEERLFQQAAGGTINLAYPPFRVEPDAASPVTVKTEKTEGCIGLKARAAPVVTLVMALLIAAAALVATLYIALHQPWMGLSLSTAAPGDILLASTTENGPNGALPSGGPVIALEGSTPHIRCRLLPSDLIEEPDAFATYEEMDAFFHRQGQLHDLLSGSQIHAELIISGTPVADKEIAVAPRRPMTSLPPVFWVQAVVGVVGFLIGAWVWSLKPAELAAFFFFLAGAGLMVSALPAAIYSTRELALPEALFWHLSGLNNFGALTFGAGMIGLFLRYPVRLARTAWAFGPTLLLGGFVVFDYLRLADGPAVTRQLPITLALAMIAIGVGVQFVRTRRDPLARSVLRWLGLSVLIGAGLFVLTIIVPTMFGLGADLSQGYAFLYFLIIYVGVALGVARYRLFDLDAWAFRILFYMVGILLIVICDTVLVLIVSFEDLPAFGLSFTVVALFYLPFRDRLWRHFMVHQSQNREQLFSQIVDIALAPAGAAQAGKWQQLLQSLFQPLHIRPAAADAAVGIDKDGLGLVLPAVATLPGWRLEYAGKGRRLFSGQDADLARELLSMMRHACESRRAFENGVAEERGRIGRDMHDNIGAQMLGALHSRDVGQKDKLIRESLTDLREIINDLSRTDRSLDEVLADLRAETADRLANAGVKLDWAFEQTAPVTLPPHLTHSLRSVVREAVSNVLRHSGAREVRITGLCSPALLRLTIADDGKGFDPAARQSGNGVTNMKTRIANIGGEIEIASSAKGTRINASLPLNRPGK